MDAIKLAAKRVRAAFVASREDLRRAGAEFISGFPVGCCEYSSGFMARYLENKGLVSTDDMEFAYESYSPTRSGEWAHTWLRVNGELNVDITADQFAKQFPAVIVAEAHPFHLRFKVNKWTPYEEAMHLIFKLYDRDGKVSRAWDVVNRRLQ